MDAPEVESQNEPDKIGPTAIKSDMSADVGDTVSLSKRRRYISGSSSGVSDEAWRSLENERPVDECGLDLRCHRRSYTEIVNSSIRMVVDNFQPNGIPPLEMNATDVKTNLILHSEEIQKQSLFQTKCNEGGQTQKRLTKQELEIADVELDLEGAELEKSKMEDMLLEWVERLEYEKADILCRKQQLEEQLLLQREKNEKDLILRDKVTGVMSVQQGFRVEESFEEIVRLRQLQTEERKKTVTLKRENDRLLHVILRLKKELDRQLETEQKVLTTEKKLQQTSEMLKAERDRRHCLEKIIRDIDRGKSPGSNSKSPSSPSVPRDGKVMYW